MSLTPAQSCKYTMKDLNAVFVVRVVHTKHIVQLSNYKLALLTPG